MKVYIVSEITYDLYILKTFLNEEKARQFKRNKEYENEHLCYQLDECEVEE